MRTFVTGASGYIGQRLVQALLQGGESVHALFRTDSSVRLPWRGVTTFEGDIRDQASVERAMDGCDRVFHLAAYARNWARDRNVFTHTNIRGTSCVLQAAVKCRIRKVVVTSTVMTLGPSNHAPLNEQCVRTSPLLTDYESSKLGAEDVARDFAAGGLDVVIVNPTRVFGRGEMTEGNSLTKMFRLYLDGLWRIIPGDGTAVGNYAFVDDVVRGHIQAMERGVSGERYILGGENVTFDTLFELFGRVSGRFHRLFHVPAGVLVGFSHAEEWRARWFRGYPMITPGWMKTFLQNVACSCSKAEHELGYRITPLEDALRQTFDWLRDSAHGRHKRFNGRTW